ncbi:hypothetical protein ABZ470_36665 [Streptosporangium sp. NPDC020072]|uniref:hypothetical protein n=1 Tax=Streptosporangium sp. NPDC020072 TaxID=3154788 RepID=UPI00341ABDB6
MTSEVGDLSPRWREARWGWWLAGTVVRVVLLLVLLFGALLVVAAAAPTGRTLSDFRAALKADRVTVVVYRASQSGTVSTDQPPAAVQPPSVEQPPPEAEAPDSSDSPEVVYALRWAEGPLVWHRIDQGPVSDGKGAYTFDRFGADIGDSGARLVQESVRQPSWWYATWPFEIPPTLGMWWVGAAWVATLMIMLGSTPRLGNRWAWFWLFGVGQIGAFAFLLLEPRPLWHRYGRPPPERGRMRGGTGCLLSIVTSVVAVGVAAAVGGLLNLLFP